MLFLGSGDVNLSRLVEMVSALHNSFGEPHAWCLAGAAYGESHDSRQGFGSV